MDTKFEIKHEVEKIRKERFTIVEGDVRAIVHINNGVIRHIEIEESYCAHDNKKLYRPIFNCGVPFIFENQLKNIESQNKVLKQINKIFTEQSYTW